MTQPAAPAAPAPAPDGIAVAPPAPPAPPERPPLPPDKTQTVLGTTSTTHYRGYIDELAEQRAAQAPQGPQAPAGTTYRAGTVGAGGKPHNETVWHGRPPAQPAQQPSAPAQAAPPPPPPPAALPPPAPLKPMWGVFAAGKSKPDAMFDDKDQAVFYVQATGQTLEVRAIKVGAVRRLVKKPCEHCGGDGFIQVEEEE